MTQLVRAQIGDRAVTVSAAYAAAKDLELLEESTHRPDGRPRPETRGSGRPVKKKTSVAARAAEKAALAAAAQQTAEGVSVTDNPALEGDAQ